MIKSKKQVLITGCYRSGTEYITLLINNHPQISASMYIVSFMRFCYDKYNPIEKSNNYCKLINDVADRIFKRWNEVFDVKKVIHECDQINNVTYGYLYDLIMSELFLSHDVQIWAEKTQLVWTKIPNFIEMFSNGKIIHIIRDPRSVLASFKKFTYHPEPAYLEAVFNCFDSMSKALDYQKNFSQEQYFIVKYEDIVMNFHQTLINIFNFLELSVDHDLFGQTGWLDARGNKWEHNSAFVDSEKSVNVEFDKIAAVNRWKNNLSLEEIGFCEKVNKGLMCEFSYIMSNIDVSLDNFLNKILQNDKLNLYYDNWKNHQIGIEKFPADPLCVDNWEENAKRN